MNSTDRGPSAQTQTSGSTSRSGTASGARRGKFDAFSWAELQLIKERVPEWAGAIEAHLAVL